MFLHKKSLYKVTNKAKCAVKYYFKRKLSKP